MSNKKQSKKNSNVLLGFLDGKIEIDDDAYATKLGGLPVWLDPKSPPSSKVCKCHNCGDPMYLIFQSYAPLSDSPYHRVFYVWGCNKRSCMRKEGSFSVIRSHMIDEGYLKAQRQKEEEKRKREEKKKAAAAKNQQAFGQGFQLGDLWGNSAGSFGNPVTGNGFGMIKASSKPTTAASIVASTLPPKKNTDQQAEQLIEKMSQLGIQQDPIDTSTLPFFPGYYLYVDDEVLDDSMMGIDLSRYQEYLDMEKNLLMEMDEGEVWQGERYEKQQLPRGVDKQFKKFTERVEYAPSQCVRYEFNGHPLFYSALQPQQQQLITSPCKYCNGPRVFEFQLMPNILSILPTTEYAAKEQPTTNTKNMDPKTLLDSWNIGMEFGTILVFACQKDCHPSSIDDIAYMEEAAIVQYETD
ncbi:programmed cell death protein 2 [Cokeromyces recurvatus]|uniref:programmed cell death protein 2 n=1 Tax=Cokeromyces recurvatus TaxID=90255 RepID=UPI00221E4C3E|nr:programmed cell death protein 2 [Cokeromyces recurvatus]KAI7897925.1 programmed cell death protein 2 [Cokeromyces recurvatus]